MGADRRSSERRSPNRGMPPPNGHRRRPFRSTPQVCSRIQPSVQLTSKIDAEPAFPPHPTSRIYVPEVFVQIQGANSSGSLWHGRFMRLRSRLGSVCVAAACLVVLAGCTSAPSISQPFASASSSASTSSPSASASSSPSASVSPSPSGSACGPADARGAAARGISTLQLPRSLEGFSWDAAGADYSG